MNEIASLLVAELGRAAVLVALAAVAVALLLAAVRSRSARVHRIAWCAVLLQGWLVVRLPIAVPWYDAPQGEGDVEPLSLPGRGQGEGDVRSLPLDGKVQGESVAASIALSSPPVEPLDPRPSPNPSLAREGSFHTPLSLPGRGQGEGDARSLSLDGRGQGEGESVSASSAISLSPVDAFGPRPSPNPSLGREGSFREPLSLPGRGQGEGDARSLSLDGRGQGEGEHVAVSTAPPPSIAIGIDRFAPALMVLWLAGIVGCVTLWLVGYVRFLRRLPVGLTADELWLDQWRELQKQQGVRRAIPLHVTGDLGPLLCRRPRGYELLVPEALWRDLSATQRAAIERHELAHYRRGDVWKSLAARALALPQWFNPLAWLAVRRFDEAAEWACDLAATEGQPRATDYARALVRLGEAATQHASYSPAAQGRTLAVRVRRLLSSGTLEDSIMKKSCLMAVAATLVVIGLVRVELVAREPADDPSANTSNDSHADDPFAATATESTQDTPPRSAGNNLFGQDFSATTTNNLVAGDSNAPETGKNTVDRDYRAVAEAAGKTFESVAAAFDTDTVTLDLLCDWSQKWLDAERKAAKTSKEDIAALEAYLARMQKIHDKIKKLREAEARGGEAEKYHGMVFYVEEAKEMLKAARAQAAEVPADGASVPSAGPPSDSNLGSLEAYKALDDSYRSRMSVVEKRMAELRTLFKNTRSKSKDSEEARKILAELQRLAEENQQIFAAWNSDRKKLGRDPRTLRFDGRTFDQWREELLTELKPERRTDAILAFRAFAANGYGRDAAQAIVDVMRGHDVWNIEGNLPEGKLKETAIEAFGTIDRADAMPVLIEALKSGNANQRQFAARVFQDKLQRDKDAAAALIKTVSDEDVKVRQVAINALAHFTPLPEGAARALIAAMRDKEVNVQGAAINVLVQPNLRSNEVAQAFIAAIANPEPGIRLTAINGAAQYNPRPEGLVPALRKALKYEEPNVVIAAIYALVPQANSGGGMIMGGEGPGMPGAMGGGVGGRGMGMDMGGGLGTKMGGAMRPGMGMKMGGGLGQRMGGMGGMMGGGRFGGADIPGKGMGMRPGMPGGRFGQGVLGGVAVDPATAAVPTGPEPIYVPEFLELLEHPNPEIRNATLMAIVALGSKSKPVLPTAIAWLRGDNSENRNLARQIIMSMGSEAKQAVPELIKILEEPKLDVNETVWAIETLGMIGPAAKEAIPAIQGAASRLPAPAPFNAPGSPSYIPEEVRQALDKIRKPPESPKAPAP